MIPIPHNVLKPGEPSEIRGAVLILTDDGVEDLEFFYPYYRFIEAGYKTEVVSAEGGDFKGKTGYKFEGALPAAAVTPSDYNLLFLPGGKAPAALKKSDDALELVRRFAATGRPIAAICHGPQLLAAAGLIRGAEIAGWPEIQEEIEAAGAVFVNRETAVDGQFITARWPGDLPVFTKTALEFLVPGQVPGARRPERTAFMGGDSLF
jgi:protease I